MCVVVVAGGLERKWAVVAGGGNQSEVAAEVGKSRLPSNVFVSIFSIMLFKIPPDSLPVPGTDGD